MPTPRIIIQTFGSARVWLDGEELHFRSRKELALFIYLLGEGGAQSRKHLTELLWPEHAHNKGRNSLRVALAHLREDFKESLEVTRDSIRFCRSLDQEIDFVAFEQAALHHGRLARQTTSTGIFLADLKLENTPLFTHWLEHRRLYYRTLAESFSSQLMDRPEPVQPIAERPLTGRHLELNALVKMVLQHRLVTVTGPAGSGKSALAVSFARIWAKQKPDCTLIRVALTPESPGHQAVETAAAEFRWWHVVSQSLGCAPAQGLVELAEQLGQGPALLILDDADGPEILADDFTDLLGLCKGLCLLLTRHRPLQLRAEHLFPLSPLVYPDTEALALLPSAQLLEFPAVAMLAERFQHFSSQTQPDPTVLGAICSALDGLPLALELAASQSVALTPLDILQLTLSPFETLETFHVDVPARQRSLKAAFENMLLAFSPAQRLLLYDLSVFQASFQIEDAAALLDQLPGALRREFRPLIECGLIQLKHPTSGTRFELLKLARHYGQFSLTPERATTLKTRHADVITRRLQATALPSGYASTLHEVVGLLDQDGRAALQWFAEQATPQSRAEGLQLVTALAWSWSLRGEARAAQTWLALFWPDADTETSLPQQFARAFTELSPFQTDSVQLRQTLTLALEAMGESQPNRLQALMYAWHSALALALILPNEQALNWLNEIEALPPAPPEISAVWWPRVCGVVLGRNGQLTLAQASLSLAYSSLKISDVSERALIAIDMQQVRGEQRSAVSLQERLDDLRGAGLQTDLPPYLLALARLQLTAGQLSEPMRLIEEQYVLWEDLNVLWGVAESLALMAKISLEHGEEQAALKLYGAAFAVCASSNPLTWPALSDLRTQLSETTARLRSGAQLRAWQEGEQLSRGARLALMRQVRLRLLLISC
jgi:predicted ATPase